MSAVTDAIKAETLIADLQRLERSLCACGAALCGHALLASFLLGFKSKPLCTPCLAKGLGRDSGPFTSHVVDTIHHRACYHAAWEWATAREPGCLLGEVSAASPASRAPDASRIEVHAELDAGDMGCGDLALELRMKLQSMQPGQVVQVVARDPGAPADIPAWCNLTGNPLVHSNHPVYLIQKGKET